MNKSLEPVLKCFGNEFYNSIGSISSDINEIRIRSDRPVVVYINNDAYVVNNSKAEKLENACGNTAYLTVASGELRNAFSRLCEYSIYKHQSDINNGFITVCGGHRIGICGSAVRKDNSIKSVVDITSLNIRIAKEYLGCSDELLKRVDFTEGVLICGVPSTGKTTLLRDLSRSLSTKRCKKTVVVDERSEITSTFNGQSIFDVGFCDVYNGYPKSIAIIQAIRTMSPEYILCDELTGEDADSVVYSLNYGVKLIATVHGDTLSNSLKNPSIIKLLKTRAFGKIVFLKNKSFGTIDKIYSMEDITLD